MSRKAYAISPVMRAADVHDYLGGEGVTRDFIAAGQLKPCCEKQPASQRGRGKGRSTVFFARGDVERCANELLQGRYPGKVGGDRKEAQ